MNDRERLAAEVRSACLHALLEAYEEAGLRGLCAEGRWEYAVDAVRHLDLAELAPTGTVGTGTVDAGTVGGG